MEYLFIAGNNKAIMKHIVIVGGGFAGVFAARGLLKRSDVKVTLISKKNYFLFFPMLHEVATGGLSGHNLAEPYRNLLHGENFDFVKDEVTDIDFKKKSVRCKNCVHKYDYLVMCTGSMTNFFGTKGAEEHCFTLKSLEDAFRLKNHVIRMVEAAFLAKDEKEHLTSVAIVGAGPTGVELSIEMQEFLEQMCKSNARFKGHPKVYLIQRGDRVIPQIPLLQKEAEKRLHKHNIHVLTNSAVTEVQRGKVIVEGGKSIDAATIIWTAGVKPRLIQTVPDVAGGKTFKVNEFLQIPEYKDVFVIGDCSSYTQNGEKSPIPALAQTASEEGKHVSKNLGRLLDKKELIPFKFNLKGQFITLGKGYGAGFIGKIKLRGFFAWWLNRTIYLFKIFGTGNKLKTAWEWTLNLFTKRDACEH